MANKTIPIEDKELVIQRLAEGLSTRQAIEGTAIASNQTAARIAQEESHAITQRRRDYVKNIESRTSSTDMDTRGYMLGQMMWATKLVRLPRDAWHLYPLEKYAGYIEVPDWDARLKVIQYIDKIQGINTSNGLQVNVLQQNNNQT